MTKIVIHLFGFETKTLVLVAPVPGHCLPLTSPVDSYKINVSLIILQIYLDELCSVGLLQKQSDGDVRAEP